MRTCSVEQLSGNIEENLLLSGLLVCDHLPVYIPAELGESCTVKFLTVAGFTPPGRE
nr:MULTISPECIES: hypothetical protein [Nitrosospira]